MFFPASFAWTLLVSRRPRTIQSGPCTHIAGFPLHAGRSLYMKNSIRDVRIAVADDHPVIRCAVGNALKHMPGFSVAASVASGAELLHALKNGKWDLIVTDLSMHGVQADEDGLHLVRQLKRRYPDTPVIVFTMLANRDILQQLDQMNVDGIVMKCDDVGAFKQVALNVTTCGGRHFSPGVRAILDRQPAPGQAPVDGLPLTKKELEIIRLFAAGLTLTEIAGRFNRAISTVATQKSAAMRKLRLKTHADVIRYAQATRLI